MLPMIMILETKWRKRNRFYCSEEDWKLNCYVKSKGVLSIRFNRPMFFTFSCFSGEERFCICTFKGSWFRQRWPFIKIHSSYSCLPSQWLSFMLHELKRQRSAKRLFLGCMTRPRAQRWVTQPRKNLLHLHPSGELIINFKRPLQEAFRVLLKVDYWSQCIIRFKFVANI